MQLSIIIVSYNVKYFLEQCLASVQRAMEGLQAEVFVVDNYSEDGSVEYLQSKYSSAKFIQNEKNVGFAKANNIALKLCKGEYVLFLNPDTIIPENILKDCISFFQTYSDAGALGVQMLDGSGSFLPESKRAFPSAIVSFCKLSGLAALFPKSSLFNKYALGNLNKDETHEIDIISGAFMMSRNNLLQKLNGFDESFFMYGEDIDLSYRLKKTGYKNYYLGNLKIVHFKGESIGNNKIKHTRAFYNAMHVFVDKYYNGFNGSFLKILLRLGIFIRSCTSFFALSIKTAGNEIKDSQKKVMHLVGDEVSTTEAEKIIQQSLNGILKIDKKETFVETASEVIIFCTGAFSFLQTIDIISCYAKKNAKKNIYMWHALNTNSIAGSSNKNSSGIIYKIDE
jgi:GT2 family glycosyltransferase